jgi:hypothetical protein
MLAVYPELLISWNEHIVMIQNLECHVDSLLIKLYSGNVLFLTWYERKTHSKK